MNKTSLEKLLIRSIRAFQEKMFSTGRSGEIRNIYMQEGTGSKETGWRDLTVRIEYVENEEYHECYISVTQGVPGGPGGYVYEE